VVVPESAPLAPSVAFDGAYLYYADYAGSTLHRINVPLAGATSTATGHIDIPIVGAASGVMTLSYDAGRGAFWAIGGDGLSMYLLSTTGAATLAFRVDPVNGRPGFVPAGQTPSEIKLAYDRTDDTIWYSSDANTRIYHYRTSADALGSAQLVAATPYIDLVPPNDMAAQCGYSQSSGVAASGHLFITVAGCNYLFEYTNTGVKVAAYAYSTYGGTSTQDVECDNRSYSVSVFWIKDGYDGHIRAFEQPSANACPFGGG